MNDARDPECQLLAEALPSSVRMICKRLVDHGHRGWAVGGSVRDILRGATADDWDIATDALPDQVMKLFRRVIPTGIKHGTVTVLIDRVGFELTTLRGESGYQDGRHPGQIDFLENIEDDLARRDFTFNAIAFDPVEVRLIDPFGGRKDLANNELRAVGVALDRFAEDGLRVMRAARFAATLKCEIESETLAAMASDIARDTLSKVSAERVRDEWLKAMLASRPSVAFELMREAQLLTACCPPLAQLDDEAWHQTMQLVDAVPADPILRLAALLHRVEKAGAIAQALKLSKEQRVRVEQSLAPHPLSYEAQWSDADVRRFIQRVGLDHKDDVITLGRAMSELGTHGFCPEVEELAQRVDAQCAAGIALTTRDLALDGGSLIAQIGMKPGPGVGRVLRELLERVTEAPNLNERDALIQLAGQIASEWDLC